MTLRTATILTAGYRATVVDDSQNEYQAVSIEEGPAFLHFPADEQEDLMTTTTRPECDTCHKTLSIAQAVVMVVADVAYVLCLDCTLAELDDDDSVSVSVALLRRLRDGIL